MGKRKKEETVYMYRRERPIFKKRHLQFIFGAVVTLPMLHSAFFRPIILFFPFLRPSGILFYSHYCTHTKKFPLFPRSKNIVLYRRVILIVLSNSEELPTISLSLHRLLSVFPCPFFYHTHLGMYVFSRTEWKACTVDNYFLHTVTVTWGGSEKWKSFPNSKVKVKGEEWQKQELPFPTRLLHSFHT